MFTRIAPNPVLCAALTLAISAYVHSSTSASDGARSVHEKNSPNDTALERAALAPLQPYIGQWRGVGQPQRGSTRGGWTETAEWAWRFDYGRAAIAFTADRSKFYSAGQITCTAEDANLTESDADMNRDRPPSPPAGERPGVRGQSNAKDRKRNVNGLLLVARRADGRGDDRFTVASANGQFTFALDRPAIPDDPNQPARIVLRQVADGKRMLLLVERRAPGDNQFARLAEIGYTRVGSQFAAGPTGPECVVTGGLGTIAVTQKGHTYYVCCTGCRDLFNDDPDVVLAEYRARKAAKK